MSIVCSRGVISRRHDARSTTRSRHWADGGDTSVANSALLCWHHHALVDARGIVMHWTGKPTTGASTVGALVETGWAFTDAHGHRIHLPEAIDALPPPDAEAA